MSNPQQVDETGPVVPAGPMVPALPSKQEMVDEIDHDRRHERYLVRAALVAALVIGLALSVRAMWG
jgi:hypothetical protein